MDYEVDLDMCRSAPGAWDEQITVGVRANSRSEAGSIAVALAHQHYPDAHEIVACEIEDYEHCDLDWRGYGVAIGSA